MEVDDVGIVCFIGKFYDSFVVFFDDKYWIGRYVIIVYYICGVEVGEDFFLER